MRSKRKQINKYNPKEAQEPKNNNNYDYLRRTSGTKPFQITKLRQAQRHSVDLVHTKNQILHKRTGSNNLYEDQSQDNIGLVIKQKIILDSNRILQSQNKPIFLKDSSNIGKIEEINYHKGQFQSIIFEQQQSQLFTNPYLNETPQKSKKQQNNHSLQTKSAQFQIFKSPIYTVVTHKHESHTLYPKENTLQNHAQEQRSRLQIRLMKQKALPPFSFTSTKWRSKSQILQLDKWKEKYGKQSKNSQNIYNKAGSLSKLDHNKQINKKIEQVKSFIHSLENQKASLPNLRRKRQIQSKSRIYKFLENKKDDIFKIQTNPELENEYNRTYQQKRKKSNQGHKKKKKQQKIQIAIKKMYGDQQSQERSKSSQEQEKNQNKQEPTAQEKEPKIKKKKLKFPEIQISTFYSTKDQQIEKRRIKLQNLNKLAKQWRFQHPPKKVYLQKIMEEIPEHWEYGESRQSNRAAEQVHTYLKIKEEQAKNDLIERELQVKKLEVQLQKPE